MTTIDDLPKPSLIALNRSKALTECIRQAINKRSTPLPFADFMELALTHPEWGYYSSPSFALGKMGDFTTAPEISPLFAKCIAKQCEQIFAQLPVKNVLEIGAGSGVLARDLLLELEQLSVLPDHYYIFEISLTLRKKQLAYLETHCPALLDRITWLDTLPTDFTGIILANEVLDALPVHCFKIENAMMNERCVNWKSDQFVWQLAPPSSKELADQLHALQHTYAFPNGYESEFNLRLPAFIQSTASALTKGVILFIDYGYGQKEYYRADRRQGTLSCFYQHHTHQDVFRWPGLQDITAHVDFTRVIESADYVGCSLLGYTTQAAFLLACGLMVYAAKEELTLSAAEQVNFHHAIKLLTLPMEMGERVKVMALGKQMELALIGFELQDRRWDL